MSPVKDQHNPHSCGSCWAQAATAVIADRTNVYEWIHNKRSATMSVGSAQYVISCSGAGSCADGGDERDVYKWMMDGNGLPHESCLNYLAKDVECRQCSHCDDNGCHSYQPGRVMTVFDYKTLSGEKAMKHAMMWHGGGGPIACAIYATDAMLEYKGGVYKEEVAQIELNHVIEVVGWGPDYWIIKNSWGVRWGEDGFMRLSMDSRFNLGVDLECSYPEVGGWLQV